MPKQHVRSEDRYCDQALRKVLHLAWKQPEPSEWHTDKHYKEQGWQNAPSTSFIKINDRELALLKLYQNDSCYQIAADNKEHIDTNKSTAKCLKASVEQYDGQNSQRPKSVYLSPVVHSVSPAVSRWLHLIAKLRLPGAIIMELTIFLVI